MKIEAYHHWFWNLYIFYVILSKLKSFNQKKSIQLETYYFAYRIHYEYILGLAILCEHFVTLWNTMHVGRNGFCSCMLATGGKIYNFQNLNRISLSLHTTKIHVMGGFISAQPAHHTLCLSNKGRTYESWLSSVLLFWTPAEILFLENTCERFYVKRSAVFSSFLF